MLYRVVVALILALVLALVTGSLYALFRGPDSGPLFRIGGGARDGQVFNYEEAHIFSGIGRLRIPLAGEPAATFVFSIGFPYPADDRLFTEELASRTGDFRSIAVSYFTSLPREKILKLDEETAKTEILERYNAVLRLGKIETLYFGDLMIVD